MKTLMITSLLALTATQADAGDLDRAAKKFVDFHKKIFRVHVKAHRAVHGFQGIAEPLDLPFVVSESVGQSRAWGIGAERPLLALDLSPDKLAHSLGPSVAGTGTIGLGR